MKDFSSCFDVAMWLRGTSACWMCNFFRKDLHPHTLWLWNTVCDCTVRLVSPLALFKLLLLEPVFPVAAPFLDLNVPRLLLHDFLSSGSISCGPPCLHWTPMDEALKKCHCFVDQPISRPTLFHKHLSHTEQEDGVPYSLIALDERVTFWL